MHLLVLKYTKEKNVLFFFLILLCPQNKIFWHFLGVLFKISDKHFCPFLYMGTPPLSYLTLYQELYNIFKKSL